jgi:hypothetical protein
MSDRRSRLFDETSGPSPSRGRWATRPNITLDVYSHEFAAVHHQASVAAQLTEAFGGILSVSAE